jgi:DNA-binding MarR family transcriptional regulator
VTAGVPLARLFTMAARQLVDGMHQRLAERGWRDVRPGFGFVLLAVRETPMTPTDLAALTGTTKQAASKLLAAMQRAGYVVRRPHPDDARATLVALAPRGRRLLRAVEETYAELEADWAALLGGGRLEDLRGDLRAVLEATNGGKLPAVRPTW